MLKKPYYKLIIAYLGDYLSRGPGAVPPGFQVEIFRGLGGSGEAGL